MIDTRNACSSLLLLLLLLLLLFCFAYSGTNKCLDVNQGNSADGTAVQVWDCNGECILLFHKKTTAFNGVGCSLVVLVRKSRAVQVQKPLTLVHDRQH
jgi:uncharacterized membrane protein YphA (DoxX/SURF4 family)